MTQPYRILRILTRIFCLLTLLAAPVMADNVQILPQFSAYKAPREVPDFGFIDGNGAQKKLSDYRGKWILLNMWATWCAPCRKEMPQLDNLQDAFADTNFQILPVSIDSAQNASKIADFYEDRDIKNLPQLNDRTSESMKILKPRGLPASWLIAPDGRAVGEISGYARWDSDEAANLIEHYLQKQ